MLCAVVPCVTASAIKSQAVGLEQELPLGMSSRSDAKTNRTKMDHRSSTTLSTLCNYCQYGGMDDLTFIPLIGLHIKAIHRFSALLKSWRFVLFEYGQMVKLEPQGSRECIM